MHIGAGVVGLYAAGFIRARKGARSGMHKSLAFIGSAEARAVGQAGDFATGALSIRRLERGRWRGGRDRG